MKKVILLVMFVIFLNGCATSSGPKFESLANKSNNKAILYLFRGDFGTKQSAYTPSLYLDDINFVDLKRSAFTYIYLKEGSHKLSLRTNIISGYPDIDMDFKVKKGERKYIEIFDPVSTSGFTFTYSSVMKEYPEKEALKQLSTKRLDPPIAFTK